LEKDDTSFYNSGDHAIWIELKSKNDSVFASTNGKVVELKKFSKSNTTITIKGKGDISVIYGYIANSLVNVGDSITPGQILGTIAKKDSNNLYRLIFYIRKKERILSKMKTLQLIDNCIK
jgi:hypothetical protein